MDGLTFDDSPAAAWECAFEAHATPTTFPLVPADKKPAGRWGQLEPGEQVPGNEETVSYGVALGARSGGVFVVDVDCKAGAVGFASLESLEGQHGALPATMSVRTPSGGLHLYFWHPAPVGSLNGWAPGIDIKGEGGYVVIPGSVDLRGRYVLEDTSPIATLPGTWADLMPQKGRKAQPVQTETESPIDARTLLIETTKRRRGPVWDAWRNVTQGVLPFDHKTAQTVAGGVDSFIRLCMFTKLSHASPEWAKVPGALLAELMAPSLSRFAAECERIGTASKWSDPDHVAGKWDAAREVAQAHQAETERNVAATQNFASRQPEPDQSGLPWIVSKDGSYLVLVPGERAAYWPALRSTTSVLSVARKAWEGLKEAPPLEVPTKSGARAITLPELAEYGAALEVQQIWRDFTIQVPSIQGDDLHLPAAQIQVEAREHADVGAWLQGLGGEWLLDWIACVPRLDMASPALWIMGKAAIGKSLLANGLARIWRPLPEPVPAEKAFARFNASLADCPIVFADEKVPENIRGFTDTDSLKRLITSTTHTLEAKMMPTQTLKGALRVIIASNDLNAIRNVGRIDRHNVEALGQRFVFITATPDTPKPREFATAERLQHGWLDEGAIAEHALYLAQTRTVPPGDRLIMRSNASAMVHNLMVQPDKHNQVLAAVVTLVVRLSRRTDIQGTRTVKASWVDGKAYVTAGSVRSVIEESKERAPTRASVGRVLATLSSGDRRSIHVPEVGARKQQPISVALLKRWADESGQPDELQKAIETLTARAATAKE